LIVKQRLATTYGIAHINIILDNKDYAQIQGHNK